MENVISEIINTIPSKLPTAGEIAARPPMTVRIHTSTNICLLKLCVWNQSQMIWIKLTINKAWKINAGKSQVIARVQAAPSTEVTKNKGKTAESPS